MKSLYFLCSKIPLLVVFVFSSALLLAQNQVVTITTVGAGSWTVPPNVTSITVEAWGGGGGGQGANGNPSAGGGGSGGGFVHATYTVVPGQSYAFNVGAGGAGGTTNNVAVNGGNSWFIDNNTIRAAGGNGAGASVTNNNTWGNGATSPLAAANAGGNLISTRGGNGGNAGNNFSGGGGSSAGDVNGNNAVGTTGGIAPTNGYPGVSGRNSNGDGASATITNIGAGGAGGRTAQTNNRNGGSGGNGQIKITYTGYCTPVASVNTTYINNFSTTGGTTDINKQNSGFSAIPYGYQNFYDTDAMTIDPGASFIMTYNVTNGRTGGSFRVWIDWNQDNIFETTEILYTKTGATAYPFITPSLNIPIGVGAGNYVMRIVYDYNNSTSPDPCILNTGTRGEAEDYKIIIPPPCTGNPTGGTAAIAPGTGAPSSNFNLSVSGSTVASGLSYQWQVSNDGTTGWTDIAGATSTGTTALTAVPLASTARYYRRKMTCANGGGEGYSNVVSFTTNAATYTNGTTQSPNALYINNLSIVGTMADPPSNNNTGAGTNGYSNFTTLPQIAQQAQGEGVNILANVGGNTMGRGRWKAWIDWNGNGTFESSELVFTTGGYAGATANFGFVVPANQEPGNYRMRIRVNNGISRTCIPFFGCSAWSENFGFDFGPTDNFTNTTTNEYYGETEDYSIKVVANCAAKIIAVVNASECGATDGKQVTLGATASQVVTEFRWYDAATDGNLVATTFPDGSGISTTYLTNPLSATTTYYVTAFNGNCQSTFRTAVKADIKPTPEITFTPSTLEICGEASVVAVSATGSKEIVHKVNENFEAGALGVFTLVQNNAMDGNTNAVKANTRFQNRTSVFPPNGNVWFPAISSGFGANKFVLATSDSKTPNVPSLPVQSALTLTASVSSVGLDNLTLKLRMYYSRYWSDDYNPAANEEYVAIEVSTNGGTSYPNQIAKLITNQGLGSNFVTLTYDLSAYVGQANLKFRIRHYSYAGGDGFLPDGIAVDDIELYGERPLQPSFIFSNDNPIGIYRDAAGAIPYVYDTGNPNNPNNFLSQVYVKPDDTQIETYSNWNVTATALLDNSCTAVGTISIANNSKVWNPTSALDVLWSDATLWKPVLAIPAVPTASKCVVINKPVIINGSTAGLAKNIKINTGGKLNIQANGSVTVTDAIINTEAATGLIVESDGNLVQNNDSAVNTGSITVMRNSPMTKNNYTYWSSPVFGQQLKLFSPLTANSRFYQYRESDNSFQTVPPLTNNFIPGKGYAIMAPGTYTYDAGIQTFPGEFVGVPTNGTKNVDTSPLEFPLQLTPITPNRGFNMIGNPYPSNIDFEVLYALNSTKIYNTAYFWTNVDPNRPSSTNGNGDAYTGNAYAIYNGTGGVPATTSGPGTGDGGTSLTPTQFIKVGQGFIVKAKQSGQLIFNNSIRNAVGSSNFMSKGASSDKDRFWLKLTTPAQNVNTILIGYIAGATNDFERDYDAPLMSVASDSFYSILNENKLGIQGKTYPLNTSDVVPLGTKHFEDGNYTVSLGDKEGIFANGQNIYLKDNQTGIITNLTQGSYTFAAIAGENTARFEIIYQPGLVLTTDAVSKEEIVVYRDGEDFVVKSQAKKITNLEMYDPNGRLLLKTKPNTTKTIIPAQDLVRGVYFLKITQDTKVTMKRVIR